MCGIDRALLQVSGSQSKAGVGWVDAPGAHRGEIVAFLADVDNTLKSLQQQVGTLTPAPFTGGDAIVKAYRDTIDPLQAKMAEHASHAAAFPPEGVAAAFRLALMELVTFSVDAPELEDDPVYVQARRLAPNCGGR
ncbi:hypothetical protein [Saccharothrix deserti]|uniref:hypothetical protein n=1 Tax=Saccharothrix deserti TaxID=2593674 RepID=UPI00131DCF46|nr:hypothetical protein [Saccharothrix deserti]